MNEYPWYVGTEPVVDICDIRTLITSLQARNNHLFMSSRFKAFVDKIITEFGYNPDSSFHNPIDDFILNHYGSLEVLPEIAFYEKLNNKPALIIEEDKLREHVDILLAANRYKYQTLINSMHFDYNPIWNVDSHEESTENRGGRNESDIHGAKNKSDQYGALTTTFDGGARSTIENQGGFTVTDNMNKNGHTTTESNYNTQMNNTGTDFLHDKHIVNDSSYENDHITTAKSNTTSSPTYQDKTTEGQHTDTHTEQSYTDQHTAASYQDKITVDRHGNIGTKTTQSMIEEERNVARFNLLREICKDIVKDITFGVYY